MKSFFSFLGKALNIARKIFIVFAVYFIVVNLFFYFLNKDQPQSSVDPIKESRKQIYKTINDPQLNSTKEGKQMVSIYRAGMCGLIGEACTNNPNDGDKNFDHSYFGFVAKAITLPYANQPASGFYWAYSGLHNAGFVPKLLAAEGIGFGALSPILGVWKVFRDAAFFLIVLVLITVGFLIMFRVKVNPQTVITLENSLPRIVISLLFITFSFAIAGFLIDFMYIATAIGVSILAKNTVFHIDGADIQSRLFGGAAGTLFNQVLWNADLLNIGPAFLAILPSIVNMTIRIGIVLFAAWLLKIWPGKFGALYDNQNSDVYGTIISIVLRFVTLALASQLSPLIFSLLIILVTGTMIYFRIFFAIFKAYIKIIIFIIFAPIFLIFHTIPGKNIVAFWIKNLVAELMTVPVVAILIVVSGIIVNTPAQQSQLWQPPFIGGGVTTNTGALKVLVGVGLLFLIPDLVKMAKGLIGIKDEGKGFGLGVFFGGLTAVGGAAFGGATKFGSIALMFGGARNMPIIGKLWDKFFPERARPTVTPPP